MLPTLAGVEPATSWSPVGRRIQLSHRGRLDRQVQYLQDREVKHLQDRQVQFLQDRLVWYLHNRQVQYLQDRQVQYNRINRYNAYRKEAEY